MSMYSYIQCDEMEQINSLPAPICAPDADETADISLLQAKLLDMKTAISLSEIFKALSDPTRLRLISLLAENEVCVHTLEAAMGMTQSAVSHQLRYLRQLGIVRYRKEGRHVYYAIEDEHVQMLFEQGLLHARHR
ncbi:MAG: ArsR family transcriptional regulator [Chloroflexi bacterium OLB15]|nr:MAG: ArsR family transcriptional regulator [Chloroflexi bacterium OLB15]